MANKPASASRSRLCFRRIPRDGAIYSLVGGFDFNDNQFNHITQAWRQPGSSFKPFIYSAALEKGFTPATVINDAPLIFDAEQTGNEPWQPKNYDGKFEGPMRMRQALLKSKNLVSIRILQSITPQYARDYISQIRFRCTKYPAYLTMALGAGSVTPMQMLTGYSVFANGGFLVTPYFIQRIEDAKALYSAKPARSPLAQAREAGYRCAQCLYHGQHAARCGQARHSHSRDATWPPGLGRQNRYHQRLVDAWFCGFHPTVAGISWMGYDQPRSLGDRETGGGAALPIWMGYMERILKDVPQAAYTMPENMVAVRINEEGFRDDNSPRIEYFYKENAPAEQVMPAAKKLNLRIPSRTNCSDFP